MISSVSTATPDWQRLADLSLAGAVLSRDDAHAVLNAPDDATHAPSKARAKKGAKRARKP